MKEKVIPIASVLIGILAFALTHQYLRGKHRELAELEAQIYRDAAKIRVMVARHDIPAGTMLKASDLRTLEVFERSVRGHAITPEHGELLIGKKTLFTIDKGNPIFWSDIEGGGTGRLALSPMISHGLRAISITAGGVTAVSGMIQPNDRIDVLGTFSFPSKSTPGEMETVTLTVLQDVTVLATGHTMAKQQWLEGGIRRATGYSTVTLEVTPSEAELLVFAEQSSGSLTLALRNPSDVSYESDLPEINFEHLQTRLPELNLYRQRRIRHKRDL